MSPSKYSPPLLTHRCQRFFFHFWNSSWNVFCGTARRSRIEFSSISFTVCNRRHFSENFHFGNNKMSAGAKSGEWGGWGTTVVSRFVKNSWIRSDGAQILRQHDASSVFRSKSGGTNFYRLLLLRKLHGQLGDNFDESQQALSQRPSRFGVVFDGHSARFETLVPLVTLRTAQTVLSISLLQHLKSLRKSFSLFESEFDADALLLKILHLSTCKKSRIVLNTHSFKRV